MKPATKQEWLAEAERYERLAREARGQVTSAKPADYYEGMALLSRGRVAKATD
jgi:hypothetical protein